MVCAFSHVIAGGLRIGGRDYAGLQADGLALQWPPYFAGTEADLAQLAQGLDTAVRGGFLSRQTACVILAARAGTPGPMRNGRVSGPKARADFFPVLKEARHDPIKRSRNPDMDTMRRELAALRAERDDAVQARATLEADLARATEQATTARTRASRAVIRAEARAMAARMGAVEPADVVRLVDLSAVTLSEDGAPQGWTRLWKPHVKAVPTCSPRPGPRPARPPAPPHPARRHVRAIPPRSMPARQARGMSGRQPARPAYAGRSRHRTMAGMPCPARTA